jgi:hypothetical protein
MCAPVLTCARAGDLPPDWDVAAGDGFLRRRLLALLEGVNPCGQQYHFVPAATGRAASLAVTYRHRLDLLTFGPRRLRLRLPVRIVGVPCSVAAPGLSLGSSETAEALADHLHRLPGLTIVLNTAAACIDDRFVSGPTLPSCRLHVTWPDFASYVAAMRSSYRRRVMQAQARGADLTAEVLTEPAQFGDDLHALYLNVFRRSRYPLECLPADFFRRFPGTVTVFRVGRRPAGFVQTTRRDDQLVFLFGGVDDGLLRTHDTYWNMLLHIVRTGIETGCREIDLGQTAETVKMRLGCRREPLYLHAFHRSRVGSQLLRRVVGRLTYDAAMEEPHVFRT